MQLSIVDVNNVILVNVSLTGTVHTSNHPFPASRERQPAASGVRRPVFPNPTKKTCGKPTVRCVVSTC